MQPIKQTNSTYETKKLSYATYPTNPLVHYAKIKKISSPMFIMQHIRLLNDKFTTKFTSLIDMNIGMLIKIIII